MFYVFRKINSLHPTALKVITLNEQDLYDVYKYALAINRLALEYITLLTEELCLIAVKNNGYALRFIDCQTDEICIATIKFVAKKCDNSGNNKNGLSNRHLFNKIADQLDGILVEEVRTCNNNFNKFGITITNYFNW